MLSHSFCFVFGVSLCRSLCLPAILLHHLFVLLYPFLSFPYDSLFPFRLLLIEQTPPHVRLYRGLLQFLAPFREQPSQLPYARLLYAHNLSASDNDTHSRKAFCGQGSNRTCTLFSLVPASFGTRNARYNSFLCTSTTTLLSVFPSRNRRKIISKKE